MKAKVKKGRNNEFVYVCKDMLTGLWHEEKKKDVTYREDELEFLNISL
jgi:hypothetical protein